MRTPIPPETRQTYHDNLAAQAKEGFKDHLISEHPTEARWLLQRPGLDRDGQDQRWEWCFATDVIADLWCKGMYVGGDVQGVVFQGGPEHPEAKVRWMGRRKGANDHYFIEKASGSGRTTIEIFQNDIALFDLGVLQDDIAKERPDEREERGSKIIEAIEDVKLGIFDSTRDSIISHLMGTGYFDDFETISHIGVVVSPHAYYAHAALARLCELLDEEK